MNRGMLRRVLIALAVAVVASSCGGDDSASPATTTTTDDLSGSIVVSAAASLTAAFGQIGAAFEAAHKNAKVTFNFGASSALATQILEGAPADVFASADEANMAKLAAEGRIVGAAHVFATNLLTIVTKPGNPKAINGLQDLAAAGVVSLCGIEVPCGKYAQAALDHAGVTIPESSVTRGQNVTATLTAVADGDAVAGIVYVTDAKSNAKVATVAIPAADNVVATYPVARLARAAQSAVAKAFVAYVLSKAGQRVLRSFGFLPAT